MTYGRAYLPGARYKWFAYGPADATATPSYQIGLTFLVLAYPRYPILFHPFCIPASKAVSASPSSLTQVTNNQPEPLSHNDGESPLLGDKDIIDVEK